MTYDTKSFLAQDKTNNKVRPIRAVSIWHARQRAINEYGFSPKTTKIITRNG